MIDEHEVHTYNISIDELMYCIVHDNNTYPKDSFLYKKEFDLKLQPNKLKSKKSRSKKKRSKKKRSKKR